MVDSEEAQKFMIEINCFAFKRVRSRMMVKSGTRMKNIMSLR